MVPARRSKASFADCSKERMGRLRKTLDRRILQREDGTFEKDIGSPNDGGLLGELYEQDDGAEVIEESLLNIKTRVTRDRVG